MNNWSTWLSHQRRAAALATFGTRLNVERVEAQQQRTEDRAPTPIVIRRGRWNDSRSPLRIRP